MSEHLPYENLDQEFNDLPLPDENASWHRMKEMLDKDDDDGRIVPPVLLKSCFGWGMLLLVGLTVAWLVLRPAGRWNETTNEKHSSSNEVRKPKDKEGSNGPSTINSNSLMEKQKSNKLPEKIQKRNYQLTQQPIGHLDQLNNLVNSFSKTKRSKRVAKAKVSETNNSTRERFNRFADNLPAKATGNSETNLSDKTISADSSLIISNQQNSTPQDSVKPKSLPQPVDSTIQKKTQPQKKLIVAAGLGLQQQIPIAGQTTVPYSYYGREGSLADYIPSIFIQLQNKHNWFVMGEFRFGAAQSVKEFSYNQNTRVDSSTMDVTMTTMRLKKTYYHQLPLSFNYYLKPNLSVGLGGMYSRFYGAVTEKETDTWNTQTQTSTNFKEIIHIKHFTDSFLYKTQVHFLVQADYQWKRFSFGFRYTKDIQPYIKYTKPDGTVDEEKNQSLQLMVRYRMWPGKL
jgi:hypothetical protein